MDERLIKDSLRTVQRMDQADSGGIQVQKAACAVDGQSAQYQYSSHSRYDGSSGYLCGRVYVDVWREKSFDDSGELHDTRVFAYESAPLLA